jgi:hypothetical protein
MALKLPPENPAAADQPATGSIAEGLTEIFETLY